MDQSTPAVGLPTMPERQHCRCGRSWTVWAITAIISTGALAVDGERQRIGRGEVTANDVYVRYGNSANHYPVCKLKAGQRVDIVGEQGEWYEILPPAGTFSWISAQYVDTVDNANGVINGDNVRVRAGSVLEEWKKRREPQGKLSKGAEVRILEASPDGFLRIVPPAGVTMWISRQYVELVPDALAEAERTPAKTPGTPGAQPAKTGAVVDGDRNAGKPAVAEPVSPLAALPMSEERQRLEQLDADVRAELAKPVLERDLKPFLEGYRAVAEQMEDDVAQHYAERRIEQVTSMLEMIEAVRNVRKLGEATETARRRALEERASTLEVIPPGPRGVDAQGELRVSALYPPGSHPQRYRLVDTTGEGERTLGYVEIPPGSPLKAEEYVGRYVGVRASATRLQVGGVDPVPIYVAGELVLLQPATAEGGSTVPGR